MSKIVQVVAGLICQNNKFLICQRPANKARGLLWEFVGGKVGNGETPTQALVRECMEELAVTVEPISVFDQVTHVYPDITVRLTLFLSKIVDGKIQKLEHNDIRWITVSQIDDFDFCPADYGILEKIKREFANGNLLQ